MRIIVACDKWYTSGKIKGSEFFTGLIKMAVVEIRRRNFTIFLQNCITKVLQKFFCVIAGAKSCVIAYAIMQKNLEVFGSNWKPLEVFRSLCYTSTHTHAK